VIGAPERVGPARSACWLRPPPRQSPPPRAEASETI
jgi:hypothetical protein